MDEPQHGECLPLALAGCASLAVGKRSGRLYAWVLPYLAQHDADDASNQHRYTNKRSPDHRKLNWS